VKVDGVVVGCICCEFLSVMHLLCMLVSIRHYTYIDMVIVVMHVVMVCGLCSHAC